MDLESMALELVEHRTLKEKEEYLLSHNRVAHIPKYSKLSYVLEEIDSERFARIGACFYHRRESDSDRKYHNICVGNGKSLFEEHPLIFEFYDELLNGNVYEDSMFPTNHKSK